MSKPSDFEAGSYVGGDRIPGHPEERTVGREVRGYLLGLGLATLLTIASFWAAQTPDIYRSGAAVALLVMQLELAVLRLAPCARRLMLHQLVLDVAQKGRRLPHIDAATPKALPRMAEDQPVFGAGHADIE